jgi:hypothetical protein
MAVTLWFEKNGVMGQFGIGGLWENWKLHIEFCVARNYILCVRPSWVATPSPDTPGHSALRSLSEATNCEQPRARTKLGVLFCDDSRRVSIKYCCSRLCFTSKRRRPGPSINLLGTGRLRSLSDVFAVGTFAVCGD